METTTKTEKPEDRELVQLTERSNLGSILMAAVEHRATGGPELELQQHHGLSSNQIPLDLLRLRPEERAVTPAPTSDRDDSKILSCNLCLRIRRARSWACINRPLTSANAVYPVLTSRPSVGGPYTDSSDVAETTGAFDSELLAPSTNSSIVLLEAHRLRTIPNNGSLASYGAQLRAR